MSLRAAVNIILFVAILPAIANFAFPGMNAVARDLLTAKGSIVFLIVGALAISLSASPVAMCIGKPQRPLRHPGVLSRPKVNTLTTRGRSRIVYSWYGLPALSS